MYNPIDLLYEEHNMINHAAEISKKLQTLIDKPESYTKSVSSLLSFFREFADSYHHNKEEAILFPEMIKANELLESGVVQEMFENHEDFRNLISEIEDSLNKKEYQVTQNKLEEYINALIDHIAVENEEVFEIAKTLFSDSELENIYFKFKDIDKELGEEKKIKLYEQLKEIETLL